MANKDLRYFMREEAKVEQIVTVPGPEVHQGREWQSDSAGN